MLQKFAKTTLRYYSNIKKPLTNLDHNVARIRVWKSGYFDADRKFSYSSPLYSFFVPYLRLGSDGNIGHVSIETNKIYASLWPHYLTVLNKLKIQEGVSSSPEIDEESEGRAPDVIVDLKTLDIEKIEVQLNTFIKSGKYHVIGDNIVFNKRIAHSCSSLALALLTEGGIRKLVPERMFIRDYIIVTPTHLAELVQAAKEKEEKLLSKEVNSVVNKF